MFIMHALCDCDEMLRDELTWSRSGRRLLGWNWRTRDRQQHIRKLPGCCITTKIKSFINIRILLHGIITPCQVMESGLKLWVTVVTLPSSSTPSIQHTEKDIKNELTRRNSRTTVWWPNTSIQLQNTSIRWQYATIRVQ